MRGCSNWLRNSRETDQANQDHRAALDLKTKTSLFSELAGLVECDLELLLLPC